MKLKKQSTGFASFLAMFTFVSIMISLSAEAAVQDEVIHACFIPDDGTDLTTEELITLRLVDLGGGMYVGTARWDFMMNTIEEGDEDVDFDLIMNASALLREDGNVEVSLIGSDIGRSVAEANEVKRFTRAIFIIDAALEGTGTGFTESENSAGGYYPLTLTPTDCP